MVGLRGLAGEGLRSVGVEPTNPIQERVLFPAPRPPSTGRSILRSLSPFVRSTDAKKGRPRPLYFASRPSGGHISNAGGCTATLLARISNKPLFVNKSLICAICSGPPGSTIDSSLSRAPLIPPPRNSDPAFRFVSGRSFKLQGVSYVQITVVYIRNIIPIGPGLPPRGPGLSGTGQWGKTNFALK